MHGLKELDLQYEHEPENEVQDMEPAEEEEGVEEEAGEGEQEIAICMK